MSDLFDETEENLRADKWAAIVKTALPWVSAFLAAALVIALSVWGWQSWQAHVAGSTSEVYEAAMDASAKGDKAGAKAKYTESAKAGSPSYKAMALMQLGAMAADDNDINGAIKNFDDAAKATSDPIFHDLAAYKAALLAMDTSSYAEMEKRLTPLTKDGRPDAPLAKEALALAKLQSGDVKGARTDLEVLSLTLGTPAGVKQRAQEVVSAIDSGAFDTAKASLKLPPAKAQPQIPGLPAGMPGQMPQDAPGQPQ